MEFKTASDGCIIICYRDAEGRRRQFKTKTKSEKIAADIAKESQIEDLEKMAQVRQLKREAIPTLLGVKTVTVKEAFAIWKKEMRFRSKSAETIYTTGTYLNQFVKQHGSTLLHEISSATIYEFINQEEDRLPTRRSKRNAVRSLYEIMTNMPDILTKGDPTRKVKIDTSNMRQDQMIEKEIVPVSHEDFEKLVQHFSDFIDSAQSAFDLRRLEMARFFWAAVQLSYWSGLRFSDVCNLEWSNLKPDSIVRKTRKRGVMVELPFDHEVLGNGILRDVIEKIPFSDPVYVFPKQHYDYMNPKLRAKFPASFSRWVKYAGIENPISYHGLRHAFATRMWSKRYAIEDIGKFMGHKSKTSTGGYIHI